MKVCLRGFRSVLISIVAVSVVTAATGCGNAQRFSGVLLDANPPGRFLLVPPDAQADEMLCGPAATAALLAYHGVDVTKLRSALDEQKPNRAWSAEDIVTVARSLGLEAYFYKGELKDALANITQGRPLLVLLRGPPRTARYPAFEWFAETAHMLTAKAHWVSVVGWTSEQNIILLDPANGYVTMNRDEFMKEWSNKACLCVLIAPGVKRGPPGGDTQHPTPSPMLEEKEK